MGQLSHLDADGHAHMIDVGSKPDTERAAVAEATVQLEPSTAVALRRRAPERRCAGRGPHCRDPGSQEDRRPHPAVPSASR